MLWAEFSAYSTVTEGWLAAGNIAITPYLISRIGRGESRYLHACDRATFVTACRELGGEASDVPRDRTGINLDGAFLMRAIVKCRRSQVGELMTLEMNRVVFPAGQTPWTSKCPTCGLPFHLVAEHTVGEVVSRTSAACAAGHRWRV